MRKLTKLEKFGLVAAVLVGGSYSYMQKVYDPQAAALKKTIVKLNSTVQEYNALSDPPSLLPLTKTLEKHTAERDALREQLTLAGGRTGAADEVVQLLDRVNGLAVEAGLTVVHLQPRDRVTGPLYDWDCFDLQLRGDHARLLYFLQRLIDLPQPVEVRQLKIERENDAGGRVRISAQLLF
ncbi:type 4a pilus biogenesis protein PilO [Desulfuromonas thiophila]|uniref:type 4a pilus biogenesis protein PilO n=1 Tax=Desulfuromonas thiophila TaxID=57664 RepID=UPI0024A9F19B|nr:type 4a pilus biogenesis protein PilO [Desulfuromonas thiophila]